MNASLSHPYHKQHARSAISLTLLAPISIPSKIPLLEILAETSQIHVHRMRKRLGEIFRSVVFGNMSNPTITDNEIHALRLALER